MGKRQNPKIIWILYYDEGVYTFGIIPNQLTRDFLIPPKSNSSRMGKIIAAFISREKKRRWLLASDGGVLFLSVDVDNAKQLLEDLCLLVRVVETEGDLTNILVESVRLMEDFFSGNGLISPKKCSADAVNDIKNAVKALDFYFGVFYKRYEKRIASLFSRQCSFFHPDDFL